LRHHREVPRVSEIRVDTIGDLAPGCAIWACCDGCRRSAKLNLVKLRMQYGPGLLLDDETLRHLQSMRAPHRGDQAR